MRSLCLLLPLLCAQAGKPVDDRAILDHITRTAVQRLEANELTDAAQLRKQLGRQSASFMLPPAQQAQARPAGLYANAKAGVLVLAGLYKCSSCPSWHVSCAGAFVLTSDGKAATNYHVIDQAPIRAFVAMSADGKIYNVSAVLAANRQSDVAIIQLKVPAGQQLAPLPVAGWAEPGASVYVLSHPDNRFYMLTKGIVSRYVRKGQTTWVCVTAEYAKGSSGCPVLNESGQVVGMVANTESIYYLNEDGKQENLQMVVRNCVPSASILRLVR